MSGSVQRKHWQPEGTHRKAYSLENAVKMTNHFLSKARRSFHLSSECDGLRESSDGCSRSDVRSLPAFVQTDVAFRQPNDHFEKTAVLRLFEREFASSVQPAFIVLRRRHGGAEIGLAEAYEC